MKVWGYESGGDLSHRVDVSLSQAPLLDRGGGGKGRHVTREDGQGCSLAGLRDRGIRSLGWSGL